MPTYSYKCTKCAHQFDVQQSITDDAIAPCPKCKGEVQKVFGKVGVTFKGTGFYRTDSAASPKPKKEN
jgi:putative FmdB family regulatory protein